MKLYSLTYEDENKVSCMMPSGLPEDNYCYVEIEYNGEKRIVKGIKGVYVLKGEKKECVLSDLDIGVYVDKLNEMLKREDVDKDKMHLNFVEEMNEVGDENERILKVFVLLVSSYLIYFNFLQFPYVVSLDLLDNERLKYFMEIRYMNDLEKSFVEQVSLLHRYFSEIFDMRTEIIDKVIEEIKEYKKRLFLDIDKKIAGVQSDISELKEMKTKLKEIFKGF